MGLGIFAHMPQSNLVANAGTQNEGRMVAVFNMYMPEANLGDNERRASSLALSHGELNVEVLKLVIFQLSNKFLQDDIEGVIDICETLGFGRRSTMKTLFNLATHELSVAAVLENIFSAAYEAQSVELVSMILEENRRHTGGQGTTVYEFPIVDALVFAIRITNIQLAEILFGSLDTIPSAVLTGSGGRQLLLACAGSDDHTFATKMAGALLSRGANIRNEISQVPGIKSSYVIADLHHAIASGNQSLVRLLAAHGADFELSLNTRISGPLHKQHPLEDLIYSHDALVAAIVQCCPSVTCTYRDAAPEELKQHMQDSDQRAWQMYELVLQRKTAHRLSDPLRRLEEEETCYQVSLDVLITAAHRGYDGFIRKSVQGIQDFYRANGKAMWPLLAAVLGGNVSTCRLLLSMGVDPNLYPPQIGASRPWLPPLHHAVYAGNMDIVKALVEYKADLNLTCNLERPLGIFPGLYDAWDKSPLSLAIEENNYHLFHFFVQSHARISHRDIDRIINKGNAKMYERLLVLGIIRTGGPKGLVWVPGPENVSYGQHVLVNLNYHEELDHRILQLLDNAFNNNPGEVSTYIIVVAASIVSQWLPYALGTLPLASIRSLLGCMQGWLEFFKESTLSGRSCLEMAMINRQNGVPEFVLSVLPTNYDSGALCASLMLAVDTSNFKPLNELLRRREFVPEINLDPILENTSIALAGYFNLRSLLFSLLRRPFPQYQCVFPSEKDWISPQDYRPSSWGFDNLNMYNPSSDEVIQRRWRDWHNVGNKRHCSPIWMITRTMDDEIISAMLNKGYRCDGKALTLVLATKKANHIPEMLIEGCTDINYQRNGLTLLDWAIMDENTAATRILARRVEDINAYVVVIYSEGSLRNPLQRAIEKSGEHAEEIVDILLDAGADANCPAHRWTSATALQIACITGKLGLARRLIRLGADGNAPRALVNGRTCLEGAAEHGRLDMVQFLLNVGVKTTGAYRVQYVRAILFATERNHQAVAELLRQHREWNAEDKLLLEEPKEWVLPHILTHPGELPLEERVDLRRWCWENRENLDMTFERALNPDAEADAYLDFSEDEEGTEIASTVVEDSNPSDDEEAAQIASD